MNLEQKIEALLFFKAEPMSLWEIGAALRAEPDEVKAAFPILKENLSTRGLRIIEHGDKVMLGTAPEMGTFFEDLRKEELTKDLSKASLETLSIVLYKENVTRSEINFIRGVNSGFILRALEVRGLVEKGAHKSDARAYVYSPTLELLSYLGVTRVSELPRYEEIKETLISKLTNSAQDENISN